MCIYTICRQRRLRHLGLVLLATIFPASVSFSAAPQLDAEKLAAIRSGMQAFVDKHEVCGAVMVVGTSQGIVYHESVGNQSLDSSRPMPKDAMFRIMSMTKPITAIGIMVLAEDGKLSIDDPVEKHLPEFKGQMLVAAKDDNSITLKKPSRPITIRDLLTHTSGLAEYPAAFAAQTKQRNVTLAEQEMMMSQRPLDTEPGSKWRYSNPGMVTLGRIIEVVSGQPYNEFLTQRVFKPLGMADTTFFPTSAQRERLAELCAQHDGRLTAATEQERALNEKTTVPSPAGGLYSTAADLAKLYQAMLNRGQLAGNRILSEESVRKMTQTQTGELETGFTPSMSYGLGFAVVKNPQGVTGMVSPGTFGHGGLYGTQGWIDPNKDVFFILLYQRTGLRNSDAAEIRGQFQSLAAQSIRQ